jgi:surfeit locus 1 family protein
MGTVEVVGLLRASEAGGSFLRRNEPASDRWYSATLAGAAIVWRSGPRLGSAAVAVSESSARGRQDPG